MHIVPRTCSLQSEGGKSEDGKSASVLEQMHVPLSQLRDLYAFVLLGDPGSGKSKTFESEAKELGVCPFKAHDFLTFDLDPNDWQGKTIFIDGLDETRAGGGDGRTVLDAIRRKLDQLGHPRFRLSCRAADWLGASDSARLKALVPEGQDFRVYRLDPLTENDIEEILQRNHEIENATAFMDKAGQNRLSELLCNPQTLAMLAKAVGPENNWPQSRLETYRLACAKLIQEPNEEHFAATQKSRSNDTALLDAAGLMSVLSLVADKQAISLSPTSRTDYLHLGTIENPDGLPLSECRQTRVFKFIDSNAFAPIHRTVAEYLAARYLAKKLDGELPAGRVLSLICGSDGGVVTGLRGLHAWLATCATSSRHRLIDIDPLGVLLYGDAKGFARDEKIWILKALQRTPILENMDWQDWNSRPFSSLTTPDMADEIERLLRSPSRSRPEQLVADCLVEGILHGDTLPKFGALLLEVARDHTRWPGIRRYALRAYLDKYLDHVESAQLLLDDIGSGRLEDDDDELLGVLLKHLYPNHIAPSKLLEYFRKPKDENLFGTYKRFWHTELIKHTEINHLADLLDEFVSVEKSRQSGWLRSGWNPTGALLATVLEAQGDLSTDRQLYDWLGIGLGEHGESDLEKEHEDRIRSWFATRPDRYKGVLAVALTKLTPNRPIWRASECLYEARQPHGMGAWWLQQAETEVKPERAMDYFGQSIASVREDAIQKTDQSGISLVDLERFAAAHEGFTQVLTNHLTSDLELHGWRKNHKKRELDFERSRITRALQFRAVLPQLQTNTATPQALHALAGAYLGRYHDARGDTSLARLKDLLHDEADLIEASISALKETVHRRDLPSVQQVIESHQKGKVFLLSLPLLVGMELMYESGPVSLQSISDDVLLIALASRYTYGADNEPAWFEHLVVVRPDLIAQTIIVYVQACLKVRIQHVHGVYALAYDEAYTGVAKIAIPELLTRFPHRANARQLQVLEYLLKAAIRHMPATSLELLVEHKLKLMSIRDRQRVYWLATGLYLRPDIYIEPIRSYVAESEVFTGHLTGFLYDQSGQWRHSYKFLETSYALMIELLGPGSSPEREHRVGAHWVSASMNRAALVRNAIDQIAASGKRDAATAFSRLEALPSLKHWVNDLHRARLKQQVSLRDAGYRYPTPGQVTETLNSGKPANAADVAAIVNEVLGEIVRAMRRSDLNIVSQFWNVNSSGYPTVSRPEESCRDALASLLRERLRRYSIECLSETRHVNEKRSDLWCTFGEWGIPIEIKKDSHRALWKAMDDQLIAHYSIDPRSHGFGVYLVLWFGGGTRMPSPNSGKKPTSAEGVKTLLDAQISEDRRGLISSFVLDCSVLNVHP